MNKDFLKKYGFIFLILIAITLSVFMRIQPAFLPVTDNWAEQSVHNAIRNQITSQVIQQYPNLPEDKVNELVSNEFDKVLKEQKIVIDTQIAQTSEYFKSQGKDINGNNYLNDIDTWVWYFYTKNLVEHGFVGDELRDGKQWQYVPAPLGSEIRGNLHIYLEYYIYKIIHFFNKDIDLMTVIFFLPLLLCALCVIPAFFIAKKKGGWFGGFIAAIVIAIAPAFLSRTPAGIVDTDPYNVLFPLYIIWFFLEAIYAKRMIFKIILGMLAGFTIAVFSYAWVGWWFIFDFLLGLSIVYILYLLMHDYFENKRFILKDKTYAIIILLFVFAISTIIFTSFVVNINVVQSIWNGPIGFIQFKQVGIENIWPNVFTTVAEQNSSTFTSTVDQLGGNLLFFLAILGIILMTFKKDEEGHFDIPYSVLLTIWFIATTYASIKGVRFVLLLAPAFAIALGIAFGIIYEYLSRQAKKLNDNIHTEIISQVIIIVLLLLLLAVPRNMFVESYNIGVNQFSMMNDAWYDSLTYIKENTPQDTIITSWWDFGHWFRAIADRPITFDGGSQNSPMAHWVGRMFLTTDEHEAIGILRMLDCGSYTGQKKIEQYMENNSLASIEVTKKIILLNITNARKELLRNGLTGEEADEVLKLTHCNPPSAIVITSDDMIGKSGVWAHFGSWNFTKADMLNKVQSMNLDQSKKYMKETFGYTDEQAVSMYYNVKNIGVQEEANTWVAPWPSYASSTIGCTKLNDTLSCSGLYINKTSWNAYFENGMHPKTFTYIKNNSTIVTKTYNESIFVSNGRELGVALINDNTIIFMDSELTGSMFNRLYYMNGIGLKHFKTFSEQVSFNGNRIVTWEVDWNGK